jgi:hypothetical protein
LTPDQIKKLAGLSVTTAEEFVGLVEAERDQVAEYLDLQVPSLLGIERRILEELPPEIARDLRQPVEDAFPLGALPPDYAGEGGG